jgi:hypothetical protein
VFSLEQVALLIGGAILQWIGAMVTDRVKKADDIDKNLATEGTKLRDKFAELDKTSSTAIATLSVGIEHLVGGVDGIRKDMREHRDVVFTRFERNENEIKEVRNMVAQSDLRLQGIQKQLGEGKGQ